MLCISNLALVFHPSHFELRKEDSHNEGLLLPYLVFAPTSFYFRFYQLKIPIKISLVVKFTKVINNHLALLRYLHIHLNRHLVTQICKIFPIV